MAAGWIEYCPTAPPEPQSRESYVEHLFSKGTRLSMAGEWRDAMLNLNQVLEMEPEHYKALSNKAGLLISLGRVEEALACVDRALEINPNYAHGWYCKGLLLFNQLRRYEDASACLERAKATEALAQIERLPKR